MNRKNILIFMTVVFILLSWMHIGNLQRKINENEELAQQTIEKSEVILGRACAELPQSLVDERLGQETERTIVTIDNPVELEDRTVFRRIDSCEYLSSSNSSYYADYIIYTYYDVEAAIDHFEEVLPKVGDREDINRPEYYASEVYEIEGAVYARFSDEIVQISLGRGNPSNSAEESIELFEYLLRFRNTEATVISA